MENLLKDPDFLWIFCYCVELHRTIHEKSGSESFRDIRDVFIPQIQSCWRAYSHEPDMLETAIRKTFCSKEAQNG